MIKKDKKNTEEETNKIEDPESMIEVEEDKEEQNDDNIEKENDILEEDHQESEEDKLLEEIKKLKEERIRALAEMENLRKRFDREKADSIKYGMINFARDVLSPGDNLERALSAINKEEDHSKSIKNLIEGLLMVKKELSSVLEKNGITKIDTLNKKFDPNLHQAMMEIENDKLEEGIVVQEIQTGYMIYDRLLRPAMVGVSKKSKKEQSLDSKKNTDKNGEVEQKE